MKHAPTKPLRRSDPCPVSRTARIVGDRWSLLLLRDLEAGPRHFRGLLQSLRGISSRTLSARLKLLVSAGVLAHRSIRGMPPRVEYSLTAIGRELLPLIACLRAFGEKWMYSREEKRAPGETQPFSQKFE